MTSRDADVEAVVHAWRLGAACVPDGDPDDRDDAGARKALDTLLARGWQRPKETNDG